MEGFLLKKGRADKGLRRRNWKQRWFLLTSERLVCYESFDLKTGQPINQKFSVNIIGAELSPTLHHNKEFTFFIRTRDDPVPLYLKAEDSFSFNLWMKELSTAVEGKQTLRTLTLTDCLSAIGIIQHKDFDVHILERNYKEKLKAIQLDQISEDEKIGRATAITAIYGRLLALYTEQEIRKKSETIEYEVNVAKLVMGPEGVGIIFQEHPITNAIKVKNVSDTICIESISPNAAEAVREGDILLEINGTSVSSMTLSMVLQRLNDYRQPLHTKVVFKFCRFMKKIQLRDFSPNTRQIQKQSVSSRRKSPILGSRATTPLKSPPTINSRSEEHDSPVFEMKIDDPNNFAEQTTSSTKVHDQHISKQDPDIAFSVEPGIVAVIHIAALNGNTMDIIVRENDSPQYLAESFVSIHGLNKLLVPTLVKEIEKSVINAQKQADITPGDQQNKVGNSSTANGQNIDNIKSESSPSVEDILQVPSEIVIKRSLSPFDHVESFVSGNHYDAEIDTFSQSSPLTEEFTHSDYSIGKFSNNNTPLIPREIPQSEDFSSSQHRYLHTNVYDRLYGHAVVMHTRKEHLKEQLEEERYQQILSTSFRANLWKKGKFRPTNVEEMNCDYEDYEDDSSTSGRRNRTPSRTVSPPQQRHTEMKVYDRLYGYAEKIKNHKEHLKKSIEEERCQEVVSTSFRTLDDTLKVPPSQAARLFEDHMAWLRSRDRHLKDLQKRLVTEKEKAMMKDLTFSPKLIVTKHMSFPRSKSADRVFEHLYEQRKTYEIHREHLAEKNSLERSQSAYFKPKISARSHYLAKRRLQQKLNASNGSANQRITVSELNLPQVTGDHTSGLDSGGNSPVNCYLFTHDGLNAHMTESLYKDMHSDINAAVVEALRTEDLQSASGKTGEISAKLNHKPSVDNFNGEIALNNRKTLAESFASNSRQSRSISPTRLCSTPTVFDRLYQAKDEMKSNQKELVHKLKPQFSHNPTINPRKSAPEEEEEEECGHQDIFEKLYNYRKKKSQDSVLARIENHRQEINEQCFSRQQYQGYLSPQKARSITPNQADSLVQRLWNSKAITDDKLMKQKQKSMEEMKKHSNAKFTHKSSEKQVADIYSAALSEIFDVLVVGADYCKKLQDRNESKVSADLTCDPDNQSSPRLCLSYADATILEPKDLSSAISVVLHAANGESQSTGPKYVTKEDFIRLTTRLMFEGKLPPIGYILSRKVQESKNAKYWTPSKSTEEIELAECKSTPTLLARKATEFLVAERYKDRNQGKQSIEDSLLSYNKIKEEKLISIKDELHKAEQAECTFQPSLIASSMRELSRTQKQRSVNQNSQQVSTIQWNSGSFAISKGQPLRLVDMNARSQYLIHPYADETDQ